MLDTRTTHDESYSVEVDDIWNNSLACMHNIE
jgi:hypothetical protein